MTCKRSEQCDNADICQFAKSTEYNLLGGSCFTPKDPQTNEEFLRSTTTEQLAEALLNIMANNEFTLYLLHTEKKSVQEMKDAVVEWLKQPHTKEE